MWDISSRKCHPTKISFRALIAVQFLIRPLLNPTLGLHGTRTNMATRPVCFAF
jgi:hypothetical protein